MGEKLLAYARLLRLSNGPTAVADVWMGYAVMAGELKPSWWIALTTLVSLALYHGGMALNDANDAEADREDNRDRPIQRGVVSRQAAYLISGVLLGGPLIIAVLLEWSESSWALFAVTIALVLSIVAYNSRLKRTVYGPLLMATCRYWNIGLGVAAATLNESTAFPDRTEYAFLGLPVYVVGFTCFARMESGGERRRDLFWSVLLCVGGLYLIALWPTLYINVPEKSLPPIVGTGQWYLVWAIVALIATRGMVAAILQPTPRNIGRGVGIAIQGLVVIDAVLATFYAGPVAGLAILALLPVTMLLSRWIPQT